MASFYDLDELHVPFDELVERNGYSGYQVSYLRCLEEGEIPPLPLEESSWREVMRSWRMELGCVLPVRHVCQGRYGLFSALGQSWVKRLAKLLDGASVLEVMAGRGWLSKALGQCGVRCHATDDMSWGWMFERRPPVTAIERMDAEAAVRRHGSRFDVLLMCWPPYGESSAAEAAAAWGIEKPIVFIGEDSGGCTADEMFFAGYEAEQADVGYPERDCLHDDVWIGRWIERG